MDNKVKAVFSHSIITELNYNMLASDILSINLEEEHIVQSTQGKIALHKGLKNCFVELIADIKTDFEEKPCRSLEISMRFFFNLKIDNLEQLSSEEDQESVFEDLRRKVEKNLTMFCRQQLRETIIQITSVDYQGALIIDDIEFDF